MVMRFFSVSLRQPLAVAATRNSADRWIAVASRAYCPGSAAALSGAFRAGGRLELVDPTPPSPLAERAQADVKGRRQVVGSLTIDAFDGRRVVAPYEMG